MRRAVAGVLAAVLLAAPGCGNDEEVSKAVTVAFLRAVGSGPPEPVLAELRAAGFVVGQNLTVLPTDDDEVHPVPEDAAEAVRGWIDDGADIIFALSSTGATAAAEVTDEIPILFLVNDPMAVGLVQSEESPEANLTGVTFRVPADRTLALAVEALPDLKRLGVIFPEQDPAAAPHRDAIAAAGPALNIEVVAEPFADDADLARSFDALSAAQVDAVLVVNAPTAIRSIANIEAIATERGIPLIANTELATTAVVVLQPDTDELTAQLGRQAVRILNGADPSDVPVENPRHFEIILNAGAAATLGLPAFLPDLLRQADEVRE